jgi:putative PIN family toxin of toxin-antitoxin system
VRVVVDTNVVISGLLWGGPPNQILRWAREGFLKAIVCEEIIDELRNILRYKRFSQRLSDLSISPNEVITFFMNLVTIVPPPGFIPKAIHEDPFDTIFLALAAEHAVHLIISGDRHLLDVKEYDTIQIVTPSEACRIIKTLSE